MDAARGLSIAGASFSAASRDSFTSDTLPFAVVARVEGGKPHSKAAVAFSDTLGSAPWGLSSCRDKLATGLRCAPDWGGGSGRLLRCALA